MTRKQLSILFLCSLCQWTAGNGIVPLLPVYAARLGARPTIAGWYLSLSYLALAAGVLVAGWLSDRLGRRKGLYVIAGAIAVPALWLMGRATNVWTLTVLTAVTWFLGGMGFALGSILAGLFAGADERGRVFGTLSLTSGLGSLIGGLSTGWLVDRWGYPAMFAAVSLLAAVWPLAALFVQDRPAPAPRAEPSAAGGRLRLGASFALFLAAGVAAAVGHFISVLGRSLAMDGLGFAATAISSVVALSSVLSLPVPLLAGWLSDRVGRKRFLFLGYGLAVAGLLAMAASSALWHFWAATALLSLALAMTGGVSPALVTDLVPREVLGRGMSFYNATGWIGGIIGYASAGYLLQGMGPVRSFLIAAALPLASLFLLIPVQQERKAP